MLVLLDWSIDIFTLIKVNKIILLQIMLQNNNSTVHVYWTVDQGKKYTCTAGKISNLTTHHSFIQGTNHNTTVATGYMLLFMISSGPDPTKIKINILIMDTHEASHVYSMSCI